MVPTCSSSSAGTKGCGDRWWDAGDFVGWRDVGEEALRNVRTFCEGLDARKYNREEHSNWRCDGGWSIDVPSRETRTDLGKTIRGRIAGGEMEGVGYMKESLRASSEEGLYGVRGIGATKVKRGIHHG